MSSLLFNTINAPNAANYAAAAEEEVKDVLHFGVNVSSSVLVGLILCQMLL